MAAFNGGAFQPELRAVDRTTGNTTLIGVLGQTTPGFAQVSWLGFEIAGGQGGWAYAVPDTGTVPGFSATTFELVFDARSLYQVGDYYAELSFDGSFVNDPATMPLTMHVSCPTCGFLLGDITDAFTSLPLEANIYVTSDSGTAITLTNVASYSLALQPDAYDFLVTADDYFSQTATITVTQGVTITTDFALVPMIAILEYSPPSVEEFMSIGDVVSNTVTVTNSGTVAFDFEVSIGGYSGPFTLVPISTVPLNPAGTGSVQEPKPGTVTNLTQFASGAPQYPATPFVQPAAGGELLVDQQPNGNNGYFTDVSCDLCGQPQVIADNFNFFEGHTVGAINIWSGYFPTDTPLPDNITVIFHVDEFGLPGAAISTQTAVPAERVQTGVILSACMSTSTPSRWMIRSV
jgi:hypothetical protein